MQGEINTSLSSNNILMVILLIRPAERQKNGYMLGPGHNG